MSDSARQSTLMMINGFFSCEAVTSTTRSIAEYHSAVRLLESLGCPTTNPQAFMEFNRGEERQAARYLWLMMCHEGFKRGLL